MGDWANDMNDFERTESDDGPEESSPLKNALNDLLVDLRRNSELLNDLERKLEPIMRPGSLDSAGPDEVVAKASPSANSPLVRSLMLAKTISEHNNTIVHIILSQLEI